MKNSILLYSDEYPLKEKIEKLKIKKIKVDPFSLYKITERDFEESKTIIDMTHFTSDLKSTYLNHLNQVFTGKILSDLSINWGDYFIQKYPQISMAFNPAINSPTQMCEVYCQSNEELKNINEFLMNLNLQSKKIKSPGICFNYPRIISMIINEAYFSQEENLATESDIDNAMKYGVNYPLGPFEWARLIGHTNIVLILNELYRVTQDLRYKVSTRLSIKV